MIDLTDYSPNQRKAITSIDKHLRIIACAGSGKTTTVAGKVAYLLDPKNDFNVSPENIIAFTFTEKAAAELKTKVLENVGHFRGMANMYTGTIHGWCLKALQENEYLYQSYSVLDEIKLKLFIDKHYDSIGMKEISKLSNPSVPLRRFVDTSLFVKIMDIIRESDNNNLPTNLQLAKKKYEAKLKENKFFDFSMILEKALENLESKTNLFSNIQSNLKYLIVDEYQDINPIQNKLIQKLQHISNCNLIVVGDDDQNIYQWRGSNNKYIINFEKNFSENSVQSIPLSENYRSSPGITKIAETLISNNKERIPNKQMLSAEKQNFERGKDILYNRYESVEEENRAIAQYINDIIGVPFTDGNGTRGLAFSDISILLRTWNKAESIVQALEDHNIPYITAGVNQLFDTPEIEAALGIFSFLYSDIDEEELELKWVSLPNNSLNKRNLQKAIENLKEKFPNLPSVDKNWEYSLQKIFWDFIYTSEAFEEAFIIETSNALFERTKERAEIMFFNFGKFSQVISDFEEINFNSSSPRFHLFSFLSFVNYVARDYYPEGWLNNPYKTPNAVQIMTIHQSKGLEFPVVILPGLNKNYLPAKKRGGLNEWHFLDRQLIVDQQRYERDPDKEDERRLLYVALTRSKKYLLLTQAPDLNNRLYKIESEYIQELNRARDGVFPVMISDKKFRFSNETKITPQPQEKVNNIALDFTTLKDIFDCPYRFKLVSVFGFRYPLNQRMGVGRSFHNCLMELHKRGKNGEIFNTEELQDLIDRQIHFPYLTNSIKLQEPLRKKVEKNVIEYHKDNHYDFEHIEFIEQDIQYKLDENILVLGRIDLIKKIKSNGQHETIIIEFKSDEENADLPITRDQLKLYALGHRELTGETADYIMTYVIGENKVKTPEKLYPEDLQEIEDKIRKSVNFIWSENFLKTNDFKKCNSCYQVRLCSRSINKEIKVRK
ncbi:ATP-dependent DNA helicase [Salinimicrobium sp. MT39]|uniref:DNA 3'-5' helicase n=1 Tax=Salinimicrobium profundisediminis TaxID=2994553 RepID=A0A9X3D0Q1_9FLAO|nr:ATP-dependent DNA helicase [Salinimicrobium profundisediminis]MCX2839109.1 ATP-dependent DNA helicase [Salinimicrobium profundisediminis]